MRARGYLGTLLLLAGLLASGASAAESLCEVPEEERPDPLTEPVELCGTTTIAGSDPATMRVTLPSDSEVTEPTVTMGQAGRYGGVVLVEEVPGRTGDALLVSSLPRDSLCDQTECPPPPTHVLSHMDGEWLDASEGGGFLPAGTYVLHLIADGVPTEVTLGFAGLSGAIELAPGSPADIEIQVLTPRVPLSPSQSVFSDGGFRDRERTGIYIAVHWAVFDPDIVYQPWVCEYREQPPDPIAYLPGCPGANGYYGSGSGWVGVHGDDTLSRVAGIRIGMPADGPIGVGQWITLGGTPKLIGALNVWMTFS